MMRTKDVDELVDAIKADADSVVSMRIDPDITWFLSLTVDQMKDVRAVVEAARAFIEKSPNGILVPWHDLRRAVEALEVAEGE
jgi:hypothetical protein